MISTVEFHHLEGTELTAHWTEEGNGFYPKRIPVVEEGRRSNRIGQGKRC